MSSSVPAPVKHAAAKATLNFDWLVPIKPWLRITEIAEATGMGETFIEDAFKASEKYNGYNGASGRRESMRIPRVFVIELLVKSAKYDADAKRDAVISCLRELTPEQLLEVSQAAQRLAHRR